MQKMKMKYMNVILILITMLALIFISIKGQETGATSTNDSTGRSGTTTGTDEAKAENEKKMEMQHTVANAKKNMVKEIQGVVMKIVQSKNPKSHDRKGGRRWCAENIFKPACSFAIIFFLSYA